MGRDVVQHACVRVQFFGHGRIVGLRLFQDRALVYYRCSYPWLDRRRTLRQQHVNECHVRRIPVGGRQDPRLPAPSFADAELGGATSSRPSETYRQLFRGAFQPKFRSLDSDFRRTRTTTSTRRSSQFRSLGSTRFFDLFILKACSLTDVQRPFKSFLTRNELVASAWGDLCGLDCARKRRNQICAEHRPEAKGSRSADPVRFCLGCRARCLGSGARPDGLVRKRWNIEVR